MTSLCFLSFITLAIIGLVIMLLMRFVFKIKAIEGWRGFFTGWIVAYFGGWLGCWVFGTWAWTIGKVYLIPAIIGSFALYLLCIAYKK